MAAVLRVAYRSILRVARRLEADGSKMPLFEGARRDKFQASIEHDKIVDIIRPELRSIIEHALVLKPNLKLAWNEGESAAFLTACDMRTVARTIFENGMHDDSEPGPESGSEVDKALTVIKTLNEQMHRTAVTTETPDEKTKLRVCISSCCSPTEGQRASSSGASSHFYYKVVILNPSMEEYIVVGRHWRFVAGNQVIEVPKFAPGVIGLFPVLRPGTAFSYTSKVVLDPDAMAALSMSKDPRGRTATMQGEFLLHDEQQTIFESGSFTTIKVRSTPLDSEVY